MGDDTRKTAEADTTRTVARDDPNASGKQPEDITGRLLAAREPQDDIEAQRLRAKLTERIVSGKSLSAPVVIDRFTVLERIGSGGLGVVYAAYDPNLDRKVALKLLNPAGQAGTDEEEGRARFVREAKAMAKLSHPNVVPVYEVGIHGEEVFIVMELVDGVQMSTWIKAKQRTWKEIVDAFRAAGRGLAAAHGAGLVHRDFKPGNVLVGNDGRVRVMDFGLATPTHPTFGEDQNPTPSGSSTEIEIADAFSTQPGTVMGTPAYMSPEQHLGKAVDAKADQFAFCVALYEGLYDERPFAWKSATELTEAVLAGNVRPAPADSDVPAWLRKVVLRGLAVDPDARWPTVQALLAALGRDPGAIWRRTGLAAAALTVAVGAGLAYGAHLEQQASLCAGASERLVGVWDDGQKVAVEKAFLATDLGYGPDTWSRIEKSLDEYTAQWSTMHRDTCEATEIRKEQAPELMHLKMACLEQRLWEVEGLSKVFARADADVVENAINAVGALTPLEYCTDEHLRTEAEATPDTAKRDDVAALRAGLAEVKGLEDAGKYADGVARAKQIVRDATDVGFKPVEAEARYRLGSLHTLAGDYEAAERELSEAAFVAEESRMDEVVAQARSLLVLVVGRHLARYEEAETWSRHAEAAVRRLRGREDIEAELLSNLGVVNGERARYAEARDQIEQSLSIRERIFGESHPLVAVSRKELGNVFYDQKEYDRAYEEYDRSAKIREQTFGSDHPEMALIHNNLGNVLSVLDRFAEAKEQHERALSIWEATLDREHPNLGLSHHNLAIATAGIGDKEGARAHYQRALEIDERALGKDHPRVSLGHAHLGWTLLELGRPDEAKDHCEEAVAGWERKLGREHPQYAYGLEILGRYYFYQSDYQRALDAWRKALEVLERAFGPSHGEVANRLAAVGKAFNRLGRHDQARPVLERALAMGPRATSEPHPDPGVVLRELARVLLSEGKRDQAVDHLERAIERHEAYGGRAGEAAETKFLLATLVLPADRNRALSLAREAKVELERRDLGLLRDPELRAVEAWLAGNG